MAKKRSEIEIFFEEPAGRGSEAVLGSFGEPKMNEEQKEALRTHRHGPARSGSAVCTGPVAKPKYSTRFRNHGGLRRIVDADANAAATPFQENLGRSC